MTAARTQTYLLTNLIRELLTPFLAKNGSKLSTLSSSLTMAGPTQCADLKINEDFSPLTAHLRSY